jgi:prepilin-type N-terminal cleavage/methylation domain-containing protein
MGTDVVLLHLIFHRRNAMHKVISNRSGFSLIELIVVIAILSIVITSAFSLFSFGNTIFRKGSSQYNVQADLRLASDFITNQLRYAALHIYESAG